MSKLNENIFPAPKMNISFVYFAYLIEWRQKVDRIFSFLQMYFLNKKLDPTFSLPTNIFVESTAFAFVSYVCWFDIHFKLIAQ